MSELIEKLRKHIPCGQVLGHGEYCATGWLCGACELRLKAAQRIEDLEAGYRRIIDFSDSQMEDGDAAREIARNLLASEKTGR